MAYKIYKYFIGAHITLSGVLAWARTFSAYQVFFCVYNIETTTRPDKIRNGTLAINKMCVTFVFTAHVRNMIIILEIIVQRTQLMHSHYANTAYLISINLVMFLAVYVFNELSFLSSIRVTLEKRAETAHT